MIIINSTKGQNITRDHSFDFFIVYKFVCLQVSMQFHVGNV